jgi:putative DNA primase/helicase
VRYDQRSKKTVATDPPRNVAAIILSRDGEWTFRRLAGVITTPTLRPDGSLLTAPGYDAVTRLLLVDPPAMPTVADRPTRDEALRALAELQDLLHGFPFVNDASRSVALSCLITPVVRGALPVAPLHAVRAPTAGSGKSFLIDVASAIATGQLCPVISAGASEEEAEKRLGAAVLTGQPIVSIDNLNGDLSGDALCQFIERPVVEIRPLGRSELIRIESRATIFATGNNLSPRGDVVRRVLLCSLDANLERPELRQFDSDPLKKVLADRGRYVAACLTIVRAYIAAGYPQACPVLASFGPWSKLVRSALVWLGCADPVDTMETARDDDPETAALAQIVETWRATIGTDALTVGEIVSRTAGAMPGLPDESALRDALVQVAGDKGHIGSLKLGHWLKRYQGRVINGMKIVSRRDGHSKQNKWCLWPAGIAGDSGSYFNPNCVSVTDKSPAWAETTPANTANTRNPSGSLPAGSSAMSIFE